MSGDGVVEGVEILELRDRVLKLEGSFAELAKWTKFNPQETPRNNGAAAPVANVDRVAPSQNTDVGNKENSQNKANEEGNLEEEMCLVCKAEVAEAMAANDDQQKNPQRTLTDKTLPAVTPIPEVRIDNPPKASDKTFSVAPIPETVSSIQSQNEASTAAPGSGVAVVEQGTNDEEVISLLIKTEEEDVVCQCKLEPESDCSSDENDTSISATRSKRSPKKVASTATKTCSGRLDNARASQNTAEKKSTTTTKSPSGLMVLKSPFISLKRLSSAQIFSIKKKMAEKSKRKWKCSHCPKILGCKSNLEIHIRSHTGERPHRCPHCPPATTQTGNLKYHIRKNHPAENQNILPCKICQNKFSSRKSLTVHMKEHLKCYFCSRTFKDMRDLGRHVAMHTTEKPFKCPHCIHSTGWEFDLKHHIRRKHPNVK